MPIVLLIAFLVALAISAGTTAAMKRIAPCYGLVANPGAHRSHKKSTPLGGGVGIFAGLVLPLSVGLILLPFADLGIDPHLLGGVNRQTSLAFGFLSCCTALMMLGLVDDRRPLGAFLKLGVQIAVTATFVALFDVRLLTTLGYMPSVVLTVLWITAVTNAFNFLDNMDGLSAGVATVCSVALLVAAMSVEPPQWFVAGTLALLIGALVGFLLFNFPPASIFMGDAGSLVIGFVLGVLTVRTTFLPADADFGARWYAVLAPLLVLALPLYDMVTVCTIRIARGKSPFKADNNHFSHRLVARGMSRRTAVLCLYLVAACTSIAAIILPQVQSHIAAALIVSQVGLILGVVALLEQHPLPEDRR
ncbi:MAG: MraY family glycosyltransferase [Planctomycetota bacterium]